MAISPGIYGTSDTALVDSFPHDFMLDLARELGLSENDMDMYFPADFGSENTPVMIVAAANKAKEHVIGTCMPSENLATFTFGEPARHYLRMYGNFMEGDNSSAKIKVIAVVRQPEHGRLVMAGNDPYGRGTYFPDEGYFGKDRVEAIVSVGDDIVRVVYNFVAQPKAVDQLEKSEWNALCPKGLYWIISETSGNPLSFFDLPGFALAQITGTGANAQITLDTDVAGHGWYIDYTPHLNEKWLPTSNPYEWQAKAGSEAEGRMDLLSQNSPTPISGTERAAGR
jgi:hypothetical protein